MNLGQRIIKRRKVLKVTQQEVANALGITPQHISAIEQDKWSPSLTLLPKLAKELGVTVDYLLTGEEGIITDIIPAIKADKTLTLKVKRALIALVEEHHASAIVEKEGTPKFVGTIPVTPKNS